MDKVKIEELLERLEKFRREWTKGRFNGDEIYSLHMHTDDEATIRASDLEEAATTIRALLEREAKLREEIEERDEWLQIVDTTPLDEFDKLGDYWVQRICVTNMTQALASVFVKFAPERIMSGFREGMRNIIHQAFVEGCIAGVRAERGQALQETDNAG